MQEKKRDRASKRSIETADNEKVINIQRQFPVVLRRPLIYGLILVTLAIIPWTIGYGMNADWVNITYYWMLICGFILAMYWIRSWVGWHYSIYVLTNQRIMIVKQNGFFTREVVDLSLNNIQNVSYKIKGVQGAMFGFGNVNIDTLSGSGALKLKFVYKPARLQRMIMDEVNKAGHKKHSKSSTN
jgi:hypothetical protein